MYYYTKLKNNNSVITNTNNFIKLSKQVFNKLGKYTLPSPDFTNMYLQTNVYKIPIVDYLQETIIGCGYKKTIEIIKKHDNKIKFVILNKPYHNKYYKLIYYSLFYKLIGIYVKDILWDHKPTNNTLIIDIHPQPLSIKNILYMKRNKTF